MISSVALSGETQAQDSELSRELWFQFAEHLASEPEVPTNLVNALAKLAIFKMQEQAYDAIESGETVQASKQLTIIATRLLDLGETELAQAAQLEAGRLAKSGSLSPAGRKKLKYGTRSLTTNYIGG